MSTPESPTAKKRRWASLVGKIAASAIAGILIAVIGTLAVLSTPPGEAWLQRQGLYLVNGLIKGQLSVGRLDLAFGRLTLENVALRSPEGETVVEAEKVSALVDFDALLRGRIHLQNLTLVKPNLSLNDDGRGLNLLRSVELIGATEPDPDEPSGPLPYVKLDALVLENGRVEYRSVEPESHYLVENITIAGNALLDGPKSQFDVSVGVRGDARVPVAAPLVVDSSMKGGFTSPQGNLNLSLGRLQVTAHGQSEGVFRTGTHVLDLEKVYLPSRELSQLLPGYPVLADIAVHGKARQAAGRMTADFDAAAGTTHVKIQGATDLNTWRAEDVRVNVTGLNLAELFAGMPRTQLSGDLTAEGGGLRLDTMEGKASLRIPVSRIEGKAVGPVLANLSASKGAVRLEKLDVKLPGVSLQANGQLRQESVKLQGKLVAADLSLLQKNLRGLLPELNLAGSGHLDFRSSGTFEHPALELSGNFATLQLTTVRITGLEVNAAVPDLKRPLDSDARLFMQTVHVAEREFRQTLAQLSTQRRNLKLEISSKGWADLSVLAEGRLDDDSAGLGLSRFDVRYPEAQWSLTQMGHLNFRDDVTEIEPMTLRSGGQTLSVALKSTPKRLDLTADLSAYDLSKFPAAFLPDDVKLKGRVDASVKGQGRNGKTRFDGEFRLQGGEFAEIEGASLQTVASYDGRRLTAKGSGEVAAPFRFDVDVPVQALLDRRPESLRALVRLDDTEVASVLALLDVDTKVGGTAALSLDVSGDARTPVVKLVVEGKNLVLEEGPPLQTTVTVEGPATGPLKAHLDAKLPSGIADVTVATEREWASLVARPPTTESALRRLGLSVQGEVRAFPLPTLTKMKLTEAPLGGSASAKLALEGSLEAPRGTVEASVKRFRTAAEMPAIDAKATAELTPNVTRVVLGAAHEGRSLGELRATVEGVLASLTSLEVVERAPFTLAGTIGPLPLELFQPSVEDAKRRVQGALKVTLDAGGTLAAPRANVVAHAEKLGVGSLAVGKVDATLKYENARGETKLVLTSPNDGRLELDGSLATRLGLPEIRAGLPKLGPSPLRARLQSHDFDLAFLSGVHPSVQVLAGRLEAKADVSGTVDTPNGKGSIAWKKGSLGLLGFGRYENIELALRGTQRSIVLDKLSGNSLGGSAYLTASAQSGAKDWGFKGSAQLERFPLVLEDQLRATLTTRASFSGDVSDSLIAVRKLAIPEAHIQLPEVKSKNLQSLDTPGDIVILRNGIRISKSAPSGSMAAGPARKGAKKTPSVPTATSPSVATTNPGGMRMGPPEPGQVPTRRFLLLVVAPQNVWVKGTDVNIELGLSDDFRVEVAEETELWGTITVRRGKVETLGRAFDVQRNSTVRFTGPMLAPYLNLTAEYVNQREEVTVYLNIRGQGTQITIRPSSNPPLSESEIYTLLATGRRQLRQGGGSSLDPNQAMSVVGSLAADQVKKVLSDKIPLDVFTVEAGQEGAVGPRVEFGTYVGDKVYLGGTYQGGRDALKGENTSTARFEYQFTPRLSFEAEAGNARAGSADIIWSRDY